MDLVGLSWGGASGAGVVVKRGGRGDARDREDVFGYPEARLARQNGPDDQLGGYRDANKEKDPNRPEVKGTQEGRRSDSTNSRIIK